MISIAAETISEYFGVNASISLQCMLKFFQYQHASTFSHHKAVAFAVERTTSFLRIRIELRTKRPDPTKASHTQGIN
ncbi:hypothetical protein M514_12643 [Trichuris suis]|uniref:Uncharacterized protein n=1 Tax=Trichuris suis TaxID=68888 RepID=A0A085LNC4_9BILA|nr:hypothetical protein M513_12643 [Trichuris suis]KFD64111.1 hypothetical protein M514_12643 [Trichuris suis]